jgi:hypothetical protein
MNALDSYNSMALNLERHWKLLLPLLMLLDYSVFTPHSIHSDNGPENDSFLWKQVCDITGIKHSLSLPFQPHSNGISERGIGTSKRFLNALCVDLQKHNSWGLLLPIACRAVNSLPREALGCSPNQLVFAAFNDTNAFVIPGAPTRPVNASQHVDANCYSIAGNFAHRAMHFQQTVTYAYSAEIQKRFDAAVAKNPLPVELLSVNDMVLIDWPERTPPSPLIRNLEDLIALEQFKTT